MGKTYTVEEQPDLTIPEDTICRAKIEEISEKTIEWVDKRTKEDKSADLLLWWFLVTSGDYTGRRIKGECRAQITNHPDNQFHNWAEAALGRELPVGTGIDPEDLLGLPVDITVRHRPDKNDSKKFWEEVDEVMPVSGFDSEVPF